MWMSRDPTSRHEMGSSTRAKHSEAMEGLEVSSNRVGLLNPMKLRFTFMVPPQMVWQLCDACLGHTLCI
jgi:hypothetical protein